MGGYIFQFKDGLSYVNMHDLFGPGSQLEAMEIQVIRQALLLRSDCEEDLSDRSKTNFLARTIAFTQIVWFGANFIGRLAEGLKITKLEVATLAYVAMTLLTYYFWMDKPFDVECPIVVAEIQPGNFGVVCTSYTPTFFQMEPFISQTSQEYRASSRFNPLPIETQ